MPEVLAVELPAGASSLNPDDPSLRLLLAGAHSGSRNIQNSKTWVDVLETIQSPFEPLGPNIVVYQRLELGSWLR